MALSSVAGVFSRYFVVGFYLPAFFIVVGLAQAVGRSFQPEVYAEASSGGQIAILGGAALFLGLLLMGLNYPILRLYEGYPLEKYGRKRPFKTLYNLMLKIQRDRFERLSRRDGFDDKWRLDRRFPTDERELLLPTGFGNAIRAFERHPFIRWHLNGIAAWPYVENLLSSQEAQVLADAKGDVCFFLNGSLLSLLGAVVIAVDRAAYGSPTSVALCLIPVAIALIAYHWSIGASIRWGEVVRAGIDLHRRELYAKLGVRTPKDFTDERDVAWHLNAALLVGEHLPDSLAASSQTSPQPPVGGQT